MWRFLEAKVVGEEQVADRCYERMAGADNIQVVVYGRSRGREVGDAIDTKCRSRRSGADADIAIVQNLEECGRSIIHDFEGAAGAGAIAKYGQLGSRRSRAGGSRADGNARIIVLQEAIAIRQTVDHEGGTAIQARGVTLHTAGRSAGVQSQVSPLDRASVGVKVEGAADLERIDRSDAGIRIVVEESAANREATSECRSRAGIGGIEAFGDNTARTDNRERRVGRSCAKPHVAGIKVNIARKSRPLARYASAHTSAVHRKTAASNIPALSGGVGSITCGIEASSSQESTEGGSRGGIRGIEE